MTANQIAFNAYVESNRHNLASEDIERSKAQSSAEQARAATSQAATAAARQMEDARHNLADEDIRRGTLVVSQGTLSESIRHNAQMETEAMRHNKSAEMIAQGQLAESARHNIASEGISRDTLKETSRHNVSLEDISRGQTRVQREVGLAQAAASQASAEASKMQAEVAGRRATEEARHNLVAESISDRDAFSHRQSSNADVLKGRAAESQAATKAELAPSEKFRNYTSAAASIISGAMKIAGGL